MKNKNNVKGDTNICGICMPTVGEAGRTGDWSEMKPEIDQEKCTPAVKGKAACFLCWLYCPEGVVSMTVPVTIDLDYCKGCGICAEECPPKAIRMVRKERAHE